MMLTLLSLLMVRVLMVRVLMVRVLMMVCISFLFDVLVEVNNRERIGFDADPEPVMLTCTLMTVSLYKILRVSLCEILRVFCRLCHPSTDHPVHRISGLKLVIWFLI